MEWTLSPLEAIVASMLRSSRIISIYGAALLLACSASPEARDDGGCPPDGDSGCSEPELEIGTGTAIFDPLSEGVGVPLVRGAQGGWHIWIAVRASGLDTGVGRLTIRKGLEGESAIEESVGITFDPPDPEGRRVFLGWPAVVAEPGCAVGERYRFEVELTTASGVRLEDEVVVVPEPGNNPPPACL